MNWSARTSASRLVVLALVLSCACGTAAQVATRIVITMPHEEAELSLDGKLIEGKGKARMFDTTLEQGRTYTFVYTATWHPNNYTVVTRSKTLEVKGGSPAWLDLSREDPTDRVRIRYVPTPPEIVDEMIKLADVKSGDIVFEPGCGDARITIAAVHAGADRGVGVDIDPERVTESTNNVKNAGLEGKVEIRLGDALDIKDLSSATVVFLYMGNEFDMLIRPILWRDLKVGSRIVSHRFLMGDWKPDKTIRVTSAVDEEYELHLWTITEELKKRAAATKGV